MSNIFQRALNYFNTSKNVVVADHNQYLREKAISLSTGQRKFDFSHPELCSTIYSCVQLVANNVSKLRLNVYRKTERGREIFHGHEWQQALGYSPDLRLSTSKWLNYTVTKMLIDGGAFYYRSDFNNQLQPQRQLKALGCVKEVVQYDDEIYYKFETVEGWIPSKDLVFFYIFSRDAITPISPIQALKNELEIQNGAEVTISNFYKNGLFQLLYMESNLEQVGLADKNKAKEYFDKIQTEIAGSQNAFAGGLLRIPPLYSLKSIPLPDLKFLESSRFTEARIAAIYNVPAWYLNISEGSTSNYSKVEQQQLNFLNNCLSNITNIILAELNDKILSVEERGKGISIDFDYSNLYTLDLESKSLYLKNLFSVGAISPNEAREQYGFEKVENEFMDCHFLQSQNQIIEKYDMWGNNKITTAPVADHPSI
jgi:HK97 family phage portal protein